MVSKKDFLAFERVRQSGVTNMFDMKVVCSLANISEKTYMEIVGDMGKTYEELKKKYMSK